MRLCLYVIMKELPNAVNLMAPDCGSWGIPSRGATRRSFHNYLGSAYQFVLSGNLMVGRSLDLQFFFNTYLTWFCIPALFQLYKWSPTLVAILRLILCCLVVLARRAIFIIENPHGSLIYRHHRFEYLTNLVAFEAQLRLICVIWTTISWPETYVWSCTPPSPKVYR